MAPFGLTEPMFVPEYWSPPSLFELAQRTGFDIEGIIFSFAIGAGTDVAMESVVVFYPLTISPEVAAIAMSGSSLLVAANALLLKRATIQGLK